MKKNILLSLFLLLPITTPLHATDFSLATVCLIAGAGIMRYFQIHYVNTVDIQKDGQATVSEDFFYIMDKLADAAKNSDLKSKTLVVHSGDSRLRYESRRHGIFCSETRAFFEGETDPSICKQYKKNAQEPVTVTVTEKVSGNCEI